MLTVDHDARVRSSVAPMQSEARVSAPQVSQLVGGHVVRLLEANGDWWRVRSADSYEGWMHSGYLENATGEEAKWRVTTGAMVRLSDGRIRKLPLGARIEPSTHVLEGNAYAPDEFSVMFPREGERIVQTAERRFAGASYMWGGGTPMACDCSGLVQSAFALHGIQLPRDAWQQAQSGEAAPATADQLAPADLLFFSDRDDKKITHVGIATGPNRMVHSAIRRGGFAVEQLNSDDAYVVRLMQQLVVVRRVV